MKTVFKWALLTGLLLCLTACAPSNQALYEQAQRYLGQKSYEQAYDTFNLLGEYQDAGQYALYCQGLSALDAGEWTLAESNFELVYDFKSANHYSRYAMARQMELEGNLYDAQAVYSQLGSLLDCPSRVATLSALIPDQAYGVAKTLYGIGEYEKAMAAFLALDDYRDSVIMAKACQNAIQEKTAAASTPAPTAALAAQNDSTLYAKLGDSLYYILETKDDQAVLLSESIQAILPVNQEGEIYAGFENSSLHTNLSSIFLNGLSSEAKAAITAITLPDKALCQTLTQAQLMAQVPDGLLEANPLISSLQNGVWWISDQGSLANNQAIVYYNGVIYEKGLPATDTRIGVRPLITLNTTVLPFKQGTGTKEDPLH